MSVSLGTLRTAVLRRLGDSTNTIWSSAEITVYIQEGYDRFCIDTKALWALDYLEDVAGTATASLPADFYEMERSTWNNKRLIPIRSIELESNNTRYETTQGDVLAYTMDKDGIGTFRKIPVPSAAAGSYTITGTYGILRKPADITSETVTGTWGVPRRLPGQEIMLGRAMTDYWGIPKRPYKEAITKIEYFRRGRAVSATADVFEIPDRCTKYVRHYACSLALKRKGLGQNVALADHYMKRYVVGVQRMLRRKSALQSRQTLQMGGGEPKRVGIPPPVYPWPYGRVAR